MGILMVTGKKMGREGGIWWRSWWVRKRRMKEHIDQMGRMRF